MFDKLRRNGVIEMVKDALDRGYDLPRKFMGPTEISWDLGDGRVSRTIVKTEDVEPVIKDLPVNRRVTFKFGKSRGGDCCEERIYDTTTWKRV